MYRHGIHICCGRQAKTKGVTCGEYYILESGRRKQSRRPARLAACYVHLFQYPLIPTPTTTLAAAAAVEATFDGYAAVEIVTWTGPFLAAVKAG